MLKFLLKTLDFLANAFDSGHAILWIYLISVAIFTLQTNLLAAAIFSIPIAYILSLVIGLIVVFLNEMIKWLLPYEPHAKLPNTSKLPHRRLP